MSNLFGQLLQGTLPGLGAPEPKHEEEGAGVLPAWMTTFMPGFAGPAAADPFAHYTDPGEVVKAAQALLDEVLPSWDAALGSLDQGQAAVVGRRITTGWGPVGRVAQAVGRNNPAGAAAAEQGLALSRTALASTVTVAGYKGHGKAARVDPGPDLEGDVAARVSAVQATLGDAAEIIRHAQAMPKPQPRTSFFQELDPARADRDAIVGLMRRHGTAGELAFLDALFAERGVLNQVHGIGYDAGSESQHEEINAIEHRAQETAVLTLDGQEKIPPKRIAQMEADAAALEAEANATLYASDGAVDHILGRYSPAERAAFFRIVDRRNLLDTLIKRGNSAHVLAAIHATPGFEGWVYDPGLASGRGLGEQAGYIAAEAARQAPGALCQFVAGVYDGMSGLPLIGGVMGDAAQQFKNLGAAADGATGAWEDGAKLRNVIAHGSGLIAEKALEMAVGGELKAGEALSTLGTLKEVKGVVDLGIEAQHAYDMVQKMRGVVTFARREWGLITTLIEKSSGEITEVVGQHLADNDVHGMETHGLAALGLMFDTLINKVKGAALAEYTDSGKAEADAAAAEQAKDPAAKAKEEQEANEPAADMAASPALRQAMAELHHAQEAAFASNDAESVAVHQAAIAAAAQKVKAAAQAQPTLGADYLKEKRLMKRARDKVAAADGGPPLGGVILPGGIDLEPIKHGLWELLKRALVDVGVEVVRGIKDEVIGALRAEIEGRKGSFDPHIGHAIAEGIAKGVVAAVKETGLPWMRKLSQLAAGLLGGFVEKHFPQWGLMIEPINAGADALGAWAWGHFAIEAWVSGHLTSLFAHLVPGDTSARKDDVLPHALPWRWPGHPGTAAAAAPGPTASGVPAGAVPEWLRISPALLMENWAS